MGVSIIIFFTEEEKYSDWLWTWGFERFKCLCLFACMHIVCHKGNVYHLSGNIQAEFCSHILETIFKNPHHQKYTVYSLISLYLSVRKEWNFVGWHYQRGRREPFNLYFPMRDLHGDDHFLMLMVLWWEWCEF